MGAGAGDGAHLRGVGGIIEIADQLLHVLGKAVLGCHVTAQRAGRGHVGAGRAAQPQIDPPRIERGKRAELLGNHKRRVVGQHDASCPDPHGPRRGGHMADHHCSRRTRDARHVVMLGQPVAVIAGPLGRTRQIDGRGKGIGGGLALGDGREIED